jgi:Zn-dependent protease with chaperone function
MITAALLLAVLAALLAWPVPAALGQANWPERDPAIALRVWQSIGLAGGLSLIGAPLVYGLPPWGSSLPRAGIALLLHGDAPSLRWDNVVGLALAVIIAGRLLWVLLISSIKVARVRARQRALLAIVVRPGADPRTMLVDVADLVAFCIPGGRPMIVLSEGMVAQLNEAELAAVIAHESAHLSGRHHLYLLPFVAWHQALPWLPAAGRAYTAVHDLVEMQADDVAARTTGRLTLASAIARTGAAKVPLGSLAVHAGPTSTRVSRLLVPPRPLPTWIRSLILIAAAALLLVPTTLLLVAGR